MRFYRPSIKHPDPAVQGFIIQLFEELERSRLEDFSRGNLAGIIDRLTEDAYATPES
jgi:hypothetical protein